LAVGGAERSRGTQISQWVDGVNEVRKRGDLQRGREARPVGIGLPAMQKGNMMPLPRLPERGGDSVLFGPRAQEAGENMDDAQWTARDRDCRRKTGGGCGQNSPIG
jgi:hypothetical protein